MKRQKGKKKGNNKDRVFGCDLVCHLEVSGQEVPQVLRSCTEFIEEHAIVDGIYRLSGVSSNIQKLRQEFDSEKTADLSKDVYFQDIHCVSSLCKAYFRELPNPLLTYQLYDKFADAVNTQLEEERLLKIRNVLQDLPVGHYRTLEFLMRHLLRMASHSSETNMHARNLAIVWAPNLLRSKEIESSGFNGTAAFMEVRVQSIVVEFILNHVEQLFGSKNLQLNPGLLPDDRRKSLPSPSSAPNLAYDEAGCRFLASQIPHTLHMGDGPPAMRPYHSIIELPEHRRKGSLKVKKWKSIFNLGRSGTDSKRKACRNEEKELKSNTRNLRPAKSMDSLSSAQFIDDGISPVMDDSRAPTVARRDSFGSVRMGSPARHPMAFSSLGPEVLLDPGVAAEPAPVLRAGLDSPRSGKAARQRAEKRVAMHISGPFSVTLPEHVTSLLFRSAEQGPESTGGSKGTRDQSSAEEDEEDEDAPRELVADNVQGGEEMMECHELTLELQDTFSFLDTQDTSETGDCESDYPGELGMPLMMPEEMEPYDYYANSDRDRTGVLEMSIESELMDRDLDSRELRAYEMQYAEFSVEPPGDEVWSQDEVPEPLAKPPGTHLFCPTVHPPLGEGSLELRAMDPATPGPDPSTEAGDTEMENHGEGSPEAENAGSPTAARFIEQERPVEERSSGGNEGHPAPGCLPQPAAPCELSVRARDECSLTSEAFMEQEEGEEEEKPAPFPLHPDLPQELACAAMRLECSPGRILHAKSLPVVPPKPHYAKLPPALKGKRRPEPPELQAAEYRPQSAPADEVTRTSPATRRQAWRCGGSISFDEAVALARERKKAPHRRLQTFARGDSLPNPVPPTSAHRDRLSLPQFPDPLRPPHPEVSPDCQTRCRSLVLEGEEAE
ncbi:rho GTPase-activating protein 30 isoform X2 [Scyliorhinus torazame]|uniref:rho GTPase-activating protein 30 isoform X2 n=1 Tax=Scyliorhinus torazame TaxID=75743 RepID=UPI003B5CCFD2